MRPGAPPPGRLSSSMRCQQQENYHPDPGDAKFIPTRKNYFWKTYLSEKRESTNPSPATLMEVQKSEPANEWQLNWLPQKKIAPRYPFRLERQWMNISVHENMYYPPELL